MDISGRIKRVVKNSKKNLFSFCCFSNVLKKLIKRNFDFFVLLYFSVRFWISWFCIVWSCSDFWNIIFEYYVNKYFLCIVDFFCGCRSLLITLRKISMMGNLRLKKPLKLFERQIWFFSLNFLQNWSHKNFPSVSHHMH